MKAIRRPTLMIAIAAIGLVTSGCPALMVPGLAYSGYQAYSKDKTPGASGPQSSEQQSKKPTNAQGQSVPSSEIE
jgi:uncharacterized membrane protein YebE (DUF533 family)